MRLNLLVLTLLSTALLAENLKDTIEETLSTNPTVLERLKNYNYTKEDITSAKSGYYPKLDISIGTGYESSKKENYAGETTLVNKTIPTNTLGLGVYQNALTYTQNIFNGFATTYKIQQQEHRTISAAYSYIEKVNDISFQIVDIYLRVMKNKELLQTAQDNIDINEEIFIKVKKLYDSGLTTLSEVNKIESSLSLAKSNYVVQENTHLDAIHNMKRLLGKYINEGSMKRPIFNATLPQSLETASQYAIKNNPSILVSAYNVKLSQATYKEKQAPYYPTFDIEISQSMNKNLSGIQGTDERFRAMLYLKYNIFNGFADDSALQQSRSQIHQEIQSKNDLRRQVLEGLELSWIAHTKLSQQIKHLEDYKKFSLKTLTLYSKEYDLGRRSLLDLLSAQNDFIGSRAQVINTEYSILFAKFRILDAMGILVPALTDTIDSIYSNVGLSNALPQPEKDTLPIYLDKDRDLIVDEKDLCANSLSSAMKDIYGCKTTFANMSQIERYTGFLFDNEANFSNEEELHNLIKQVQTYGFENLKFDILGHVDSDKDEQTMLSLSAQRAEIVKDILIKAGAAKDSITVHAMSNEAPIYTNETSIGQKRNNRVDIVVKKINK